jgi:hypothetical protein
MEWSCCETAVFIRCCPQRRDTCQDKLYCPGGFCVDVDTEIDWKAYMEQVAQFLAGERDYAVIKGGTGPLWYVVYGRVDGSYPAGHVWIYTGLYKITSEGKDVFSAQIVFVLLYLTTLAITLSVYRTAKVQHRQLR